MNPRHVFLLREVMEEAGSKNATHVVNATRSSLLERLRELDDDESWSEFFNLYWKLIYSTARKSGLADAEAQDVVQETLITVARHIRDFEYDRARGSFKGWLLTLTRSRITDHIRHRQRRAVVDNALGGELAEELENFPDPTVILPDAQWDADWHKNLADTAMQRVQQNVSAKHFQIFHCYVIEKWSVAEISRALRVSAGLVYVTKHRLGRMFERELETLRREEDSR
ncbi:MAG: sigma-70 family RNA polymerase sigma factor [Verrucomicrobia subdivision 3 bacterium]|nr:sigma-70 family RNA polymerase sigma factor [Limisphaerales bacterium]